MWWEFLVVKSFYDMAAFGTLVMVLLDCLASVWLSYVWGCACFFYWYIISVLVQNVG